MASGKRYARVHTGMATTLEYLPGKFCREFVHRPAEDGSGLARLFHRQRADQRAPRDNRAEQTHQQRPQRIEHADRARTEAVGEEVDLDVAMIEMAPGEERGRGEGRAQLQQFDIAWNRCRGDLAADDRYDRQDHQPDEDEAAEHGRNPAQHAQQAAVATQTRIDLAHVR